MGSIVEAALYDIVGKFFLLFVIVPAGVIFLGYVIYMIAKILQELRKKWNHICGEPASQAGTQALFKAVHRRGRDTATVVPASELFSTHTVPPWSLTISHTSESPKPTPPYSRLRDLSTRKKGWKTLR